MQHRVFMAEICCKKTFVYQSFDHCVIVLKNMSSSKYLGLCRLYITSVLITLITLFNIYFFIQRCPLYLSLSKLFFLSLFYNILMSYFICFHFYLKYQLETHFKSKQTQNYYIVYQPYNKHIVLSLLVSSCAYPKEIIKRDYKTIFVILADLVALSLLL